MKCIDFEDRLNELLDDRCPAQDDPLLLAHARQCPSCREMLAAEASLFRGLRLLERRTPTPELGSRILAELATPTVALPPIPPPRFHLPWMSIISSAAILLVAVSVGAWIAGRARPELATDPSPAHGQRVSGEGLALIEPGRARGPAHADETASPRNLVGAAPATRVAPEVSPAETSEVYRQAMESLSAHWPQAKWSETTWPQVESIDVEHYAPGIRPIRESFEVAIDGLLRTLPGMKDSRPTQPQAHQSILDGLYLS